MKGLKKLALVSAIAMTSAGAFAMEAADDQLLSDTTGQQGITIDVAPGAMSLTAINAQFGMATGAGSSLGTLDAAGTATIVRGLTIGKVLVKDSDGFTGSTSAGALVIGGGTSGTDATDQTLVMADDVNPIVINVDSSGNGTNPVLNVEIKTPTLLIKTGNIYVADNTGANATKVLNGMEMTLGATTINVQLGHELQTSTILNPLGTAALNQTTTALALVNATLSGGLTINETKIDDGAGVASGTTLDITGGSIYVKSMAIKDSTAGYANGANLTANVAVNVEDNLVTAFNMGTATDPDAATGGLVITLASLGGAKGINVAMTDVTLGKVTLASGTIDHATAGASAKSLGDVEILGLNLNGTSLIIHGH